MSRYVRWLLVSSLMPISAWMALAGTVMAQSFVCPGTYNYRNNCVSHHDCGPTNPDCASAEEVIPNDNYFFIGYLTGSSSQAWTTEYVDTCYNYYECQIGNQGFCESWGDLLLGPDQNLTEESGC